MLMGLLGKRGRYANFDKPSQPHERSRRRKPGRNLQPGRPACGWSGKANCPARPHKRSADPPNPPRPPRLNGHGAIVACAVGEGERKRPDVVTRGQPSCGFLTPSCACNCTGVALISPLSPRFRTPIQRPPEKANSYQKLSSNAPQRMAPNAWPTPFQKKVWRLQAFSRPCGIGGWPGNREPQPS